MEQEIFFTNKDFDFSKITISQPVAVQGGAYFTKIKYDNNPLYIQTHKCLTKQGLNETSKRAYIDLMYTNEDDEIIEWFESLESKLIELIYSKKDLWFQNEMDMSDIENSFNSITRAFRGGKYHLIRTIIPKNKTMSSQYNCTMYDENENMLEINELNETHSIIPILEIQGIKFSARSFHVEVVGKQIMILNNKPIFNSCLIKKKNTETSKHLEDNSDIKNNENNTNTLEEIETNTEEDTVNDIIDNENKNTEIINDLLNTDNDDKDLSIEDTSSRDMLMEKEQQITIPDVSCDGNKLLEDTTTYNNNTVDTLEQVDTLEETVYHKNDTIEKKPNDLEEITNDITTDNTSKSEIKLKKPNEVYLEIYRITREKAKQHKKAAIAHYLEAKKIRNSYLLEDIDNSDDSSDDEYINDSDKIKNEINDLVEDIS